MKKSILLAVILAAILLGIYFLQPFDKEHSITITPQTSEIELNEIIAQLAEDDVDLVFNAIKRNERNEITVIDGSIEGRVSSGSFSSGNDSIAFELLKIKINPGEFSITVE